MGDAETLGLVKTQLVQVLLNHVNGVVIYSLRNALIYQLGCCVTLERGESLAARSLHLFVFVHY